MSRVPDDWNAFWAKCRFCGGRYHMSEGGCDCVDNYPDCACGKREWEIHSPIAFCSDGDVRCSHCGSAPGDKKWVFEEKMSKRTFYRRVFYIEVLSEGPIPEDVVLGDILINIDDGPWSGKMHSDDQEEVDGKTMAGYLAAQDSSPSFFGLTDDGEDDEERICDNRNAGGTRKGDMMKVKQEKALTRSEIIEMAAEETGLSKKEVTAVLTAVAGLMAKQMKTKDPEGKFFAFVIPFMGVKAQVIVKPATKKRMGRNPATGEAVEIAAKKARRAVKARVMKALKDAVL